MENLLKIAKVSKSDGTDGAVVFSFLSFDPDDLEISEPVFVHFDGLPVPFFIEDFTRRGAGKAVVRLNDILSSEDAEELVGKEVYVEDDGESEMDFDLAGWTVETVATDDGAVHNAGCRPKGGSTATSVLGEVTDFLDIPGNPCIEVMPAGDCRGAKNPGDKKSGAQVSGDKKSGAQASGDKKGAVIIPLHEDFIVSADPETRTLVMSLPEGLL